MLQLCLVALLNLLNLCYCWEGINNNFLCTGGGLAVEERILVCPH